MTWQPEEEPEHPPKRPYHTLHIRPYRDDFMCDFENDVLRCWDARKGIPKGPHRFENQEWAALIKRYVFPHHSDVDWFEYIAWVRDGGGDEWFQEEYFPPENGEARSAYLETEEEVLNRPLR